MRGLAIILVFLLVGLDSTVDAQTTLQQRNELLFQQINQVHRLSDVEMSRRNGCNEFLFRVTGCCFYQARLARIACL